MKCRLCGHQCSVERDMLQTGFCKADNLIGFSAALLHKGEEPPISGDLGAIAGSGTIFFTGCVLKCIFCQNWPISQSPNGIKINSDQLADKMLELQQNSAFNINLVSPTPYIPLIVKALEKAKNLGLKIPVIYNTGGYESLEALKMLDGLVDIYLPDAKIAPLNEETKSYDKTSLDLFGAANYPLINQQAILEMFRQVGHLKIDEKGLAYKGLLVRHLVLPNNIARSDILIHWLAEHLGTDVYLSFMSQYYPDNLTKNGNKKFPSLARKLTAKEYDKFLDLLIDLNFENVFIQDLSSATNYKPNFFDSKISFKI